MSPTGEMDKVTKSTVRRINVYKKLLLPREDGNMLSNNIVINNNCTPFCRHKSTDNAGRKVTIGDVSKLTNIPKNPEYVPLNYLNKNLTQSTLSDLRWMLQKDNLGQDIFLIGRPGISRRRLAMSYLELTDQEVEFVSLSRDTTESDLKQRREIINGSAKYLHQSAVRAAVEGRVLILEGIEKAERNVLPVLNNLLENREMHLEDGRFLISPSNYDKLFKEYGKEHIDQTNLIRVSDNFRVIALGLPVPNYMGNPLDPPLRSRFQARDITIPPYEELKNELITSYPEVQKQKLDDLMGTGYALLSPESKSLSLPDFPLDNIRYAAKILENDPDAEIYTIFCCLYPYSSMLTTEGKKAVESILGSFHVKRIKQSHLQIIQKQIINDEKAVMYTNSNVPFEVPTGQTNSDGRDSKFIEFTYHNHFLTDIVRTHSAGDFCVIGPSGCGKSILIKKFAELLNYEIEPVILYQDMTGRDLIQRRETLSNGDTVWQNSSLVDAALEGKLAVLDGIHRLHASTLSILHRLVHDRELQLHDGQRLIHHNRYDSLAATYGLSRMNELGIRRIHPSFRIIALAEPPGSNIANWLSPEVLTLFLYHEMRYLSVKEKLHLVQSMFGQIKNNIIDDIMEISEKLRASKDPNIVSLTRSLSTRQILRIAKRASIYSNLNVYDTIERACLARFLPPLTRQALEDILRRCNLQPSVKPPGNCVNKISVNDSEVRIGSTVVQRYKTSAFTKIPNTLFYDLPQHTELLEQMLQDFSIGEHLLLVGNQGVGKNKLTDKLLQLLNRPREYIQLHRDTTVQSLTLQPTIINGIVHYEDSPLVKAIISGHVLVIDEADKAPTHVTCILKTLVECGEMVLSDGRRIVPSNTIAIKHCHIKMHPDFRIIVLANRPGFPFLGNNLFAALGDLFSCHIIDNPSTESEKQLLHSYGPNVSPDIIDRIVEAFGELRNLADKGIVSYPYSTREAVNIVKHLQAYPGDGLSEAIYNVFDFDRYSNEVRDILQRVLTQHKIPVQLAGLKKSKDRELQVTIERKSGLDVSGPKHGKVDEKGDPHVGGNTWAGGTGGRDTAGLGGKGGPYRLDAGHKVHQLSDEEKNSVPEHIQKAAREMGQKAFKERLKEIRMSEYDANVYNQFYSSVEKQIQALRVILGNLQVKSKERYWVRHQTSGELDDTKLIEGITGEKVIYRRRADIEPELGAPQLKPKRLRLVVDVSGSMYRFNGYDGRLDREMEAVVMVMEAIQGYESRIMYDIVGHSGEALNIVFVPKKNPPVDNKQRLEIIKTMHAHAQFCWSGDNTLKAIRDSISQLEKEKDEFDEGIVIILSDANLKRYGIAPTELTAALQSSRTVRAYAIFIGSIGNEANRLANSLPAGRGFVCLDLQNIPQIIQQIFTSSLLSTSE